ncbi:SLAC1 family transporter [Nocardiopsis oceani]
MRPPVGVFALPVKEPIGGSMTAGTAGRERPALPGAGRGARFTGVRIEWFSIPLGLVGLGGAWSVSADLMQAPVWVGEGFYAASALVWVVFTASYALGVATGPGSLRSELHHPVTGPLITYVPIVPILLAVHYTEHLPGIGPWIIWPSTAALVVLFAVLTAHWLTAELGADALHPGYIMPVATGPFIASIGLTSLGHPALALTTFGGAVFFWLIMGSLIFSRLINGTPLDREALPVLSVLVVTPAAAGVAWLVVRDGQVDTFTWIFLGATAMTATTVLALIPSLVRAPITMGYWAFVFPAATGTNLVTRVTHGVSAPAADLLSWSLLIAATLVFLGVVSATLVVAPVRAARKRRAMGPYDPRYQVQP